MKMRRQELAHILFSPQLAHDLGDRQFGKNTRGLQLQRQKIGQHFTRLLCFGWQEATRHLAITIDCLANNEVKKSSARCPSSRHLWAYRINPSMSACAC